MVDTDFGSKIDFASNTIVAKKPHKWLEWAEFYHTYRIVGFGVTITLVDVQDRSASGVTYAFMAHTAKTLAAVPAVTAAAVTFPRYECENARQKVVDSWDNANGGPIKFSLFRKIKKMQDPELFLTNWTAVTAETPNPTTMQLGLYRIDHTGFGAETPSYRFEAKWFWSVQYRDPKIQV